MKRKKRKQYTYKAVNVSESILRKTQRESRREYTGDREQTWSCIHFPSALILFCLFACATIEFQRQSHTLFFLNIKSDIDNDDNHWCQTLNWNFKPILGASNVFVYSITKPPIRRHQKKALFALLICHLYILFPVISLYFFLLFACRCASFWHHKKFFFYNFATRINLFQFGSLFSFFCSIRLYRFFLFCFYSTFFCSLIHV